MIANIHIKDVKGVTGSFKLGKITNIIGANGTGKSAILDSIRIGLTGYTELGKLSGKTFQLASGRSMEVSIESAAGRTLSRKFERSGAGAKQTIMVNGETIAEKDLQIPVCFDYPVESIHPSEFLAMSGEKRADFVFSSLPAEINAISPEDLKEKLPFFQKAMSFSELLETLKAKKSELEKEIKRCIANIQKLTGEVGELPAGNLNEWEEKKKTAAAELEKATGEISANEERARLATSKAEHAAKIQRNIEESAQKILQTEQSIARMQSCILAVPECHNLQILELEKIKQTKALTVARTTKTDIDSRLEILQEKGCCPFCNALATALENSMDEWELKSFNLGSEIDTLSASLSEIEAEIKKSNEAARIVACNENCQRSIKVDQDALKSYRKFNAENVEALAKLESNNDEAPVSLEILRGKAEGLKLNIREADENIKKFVSVQSVRSQKSKSESERLDLEKDLENIKAAMDSVKVNRDTRLADASVQLAAPFKTMIEATSSRPSFLSLIGDNDKPCFNFGVVKNNKEIGFDTLSGGEKTVLLAALVACIQIVKTGRPGIGLFELAEADANSTAAVVKAADAIGFEQIIIASCHGQHIDGATNIEMQEAW